MTTLARAAHQILVAGRAHRDVPPDRASWSVEIRGDGHDESSAFADCSQLSDVMLATLRELVGADGDVSTERLHSQPVWDSDRKRYIGHTAFMTLRVESPVALASKVAGVAMGRAGIKMRGPNFAISNSEEIREELLSDAIAAARHKADRLAQAAGREAGRVVLVREAGIDMGNPYSDYRDAGVVYDMAAAGPEIATRDFTITAEVTVAVEFSD